MPITFHPTTLQIKPKMRLTGGPRFSNTYQEDAARNPQSNIIWDEAKWEWDLKFIKGSLEFGAARGFWLARNGGAIGWWLLDPLDQFAATGGGRGVARLMADGKTYTFKEYPDEFKPYQRWIMCPVPGTVHTLDDDLVEVNPYTGEILSEIADGTTLNFQFRCPVVFAGDFQEIDYAPQNAPAEWQVKVMEIGEFRVEEAP